jgi:hypothetical protein
MGPFAAGDWPDVEMFRFALKNMLDDGERVEADDGYVGEDPLKIKTPGSFVHDQDNRQLYVRAKVRLRHETANKRFKQFNILRKLYDGDMEFHGSIFRACAVLTQLSINLGAPLFDTSEYEDRERTAEADGTAAPRRRRRVEVETVNSDSD